MAKKARTNNNAALIATIIIALLAAVAAFFAVWKFSSASQQDKDLQQEMNQIYQPSEELSEEMKDAATELIRQNYTALKLYYTKGLPHIDEPYGNLPEGGYYYVDTEKTEYTQLSQLEDVLSTTFSDGEAVRIFAETNLYGERDGQLAINAEFIPMEYNISWENVDFRVIPRSDTECDIEITLHDSDGAEVTRTGSMSKLNGAWLLNSIIY